MRQTRILIAAALLSSASWGCGGDDTSNASDADDSDDLPRGTAPSKPADDAAVTTGGGAPGLMGATTDARVGDASSLRADAGSPRADAGGGMANLGPAGDGDVCGALEGKPNDTREQATQLALDTSVAACLQSSVDVDIYEFTAPATPVQGSVFVIRAGNVAPGLGLSLRVDTVKGNGEIFQEDYEPGPDATAWLGAKAGSSFRIAVERASGAQSGGYNLQVAVTGVDDKNEPNNDRDEATRVTLDTPVQGYLFSGFDEHNQSWEPFDDWYRIDLAQGKYDVTVKGVKDVDTILSVFDMHGKQIGSDIRHEPGVDQLAVVTAAGGSYYIALRSSDDSFMGQTKQAIPLRNNTEPYTLKVSASTGTVAP